MKNSHLFSEAFLKISAAFKKVFLVDAPFHKLRTQKILNQKFLNLVTHLALNVACTAKIIYIFLSIFHRKPICKLKILSFGFLRNKISLCLNKNKSTGYEDMFSFELT